MDLFINDSALQKYSHLLNFATSHVDLHVDFLVVPYI